MASIVSAGTTSATALNMSADTSGVLQLASNNGTVALTVDTSQNVGIGTSSPDSKLAVYNATGTSQFRFGASSSYYWDISRDNDVTGNLLFSNNNATSRTTRMVIDTSGNLGIGTSSPAKRLQSTDSNGDVLRLQRSGAFTGLWDIKIGSATTGDFTLTDAENSVSPLIIEKGTGLANAIYVKSNGNVGIGTSSPGVKLDVNPGSSGGAIRVINSANTNTAKLTAQNSQSSIDMGQDGSGGFIEQAGAYPIRFFTNNTERARIDSSGNLLVGVTSASNRLYVKQTTTSIVNTYLEHSGASPYGFQIYYSGAAPNNTDNEFIYCSDTSNNRFIVYSSGNVANRNNSYGGISDIKLKENITDATPKLEQLNQVRIVNYNLIGEETKQIGVIAQELEQIFPGMVEESNDYENITTTDEDGNEKTERVLAGTTTKQVKYSVFVPMLIKAIQEQQAIIETLTNRITALEAK